MMPEPFRTPEDAAAMAYQLMQAIPRDARGAPLTLEGALRSVLLKSPDMMQYRDDALGVLYCVLGSGIRWHQGRLSDCAPNNYMNLPPTIGGQGCWSASFGQEEMLARMCQGMPQHLHAPLLRDFVHTHDARLKRATDTIVQIDARCQQYRPEGPSWYPISWFRCNLCAPADAQEDFLLGAIETASLILRTEPTPGTQRWIVHQRTRQYAAEILVVLQQQWEGRQHA